MKNDISIADIRKAIAELVQAQRESRIAEEKRSEELDRRRAETDRLMAERKAETDRLMAESRAETDKRMAETDERLNKFAAESERGFKELRKQLGGLGERFGSFTEGMAINSMERILRRDFKADHVSARSKVYDKTGKVAAEYDILAWCNSDVNNVVVVEVKSTLRPEYVNDFEKVLNEFKNLNPELANKNLYGILAFVGNFDKNIQERCQNKGIYTATIHDEIFKLNADKAFKPKNFNFPQ